MSALSKRLLAYAEGEEHDLDTYLERSSPSETDPYVVYCRQFIADLYTAAKYMEEMND